MYNRYIEEIIIWLRSDLQISTTCKNLRDEICKVASDPNFFSHEISGNFDNIRHNYKIDGNESSQVELLKKIINTLTKAEQSIAKIENLNINRNSSKVIDGAILLYNARNIINEIYDLVELIDESPAHLKHLLKPLNTQLMPKLNQLMPSLTNAIDGSSSPLSYTERLGQIGGSAANLLPKSEMSAKGAQNLFVQELFNLPAYFSKISESLNNNQDESIALDFRQLNHKAAKAQLKVNSLMKSTNIISRSYNCVGSLKAIAAITTDLLNTSQPLTRKSYLRSAKLLNQLRHHYLPELITQLDQVEVNLGLKPGVLTKPLIDKLDIYYTKITEQVNNMATADQAILNIKQHGDTWYGKIARWYLNDNSSKINHLEALIEITPDLTTLQDSHFIEKRIERLQQQTTVPTEKLTNLIRIELFATSFFSTMDSIWSAINLGEIKQLSITRRLQLASEYKQFQQYVTNKDLKVDKLLVKTLTVTPEERIKLIAECNLDQTQKEALTKSLNVSISKAQDCINQFNLENKDHEKALLLAIDSNDCSQPNFANLIKELHEPIVKQGFFWSALSITSSVVGAALYGALVIGQIALPSPDEFIGIRQLKSPVLGLIKRDIADQQLKLSLIEKQQLLIINTVQDLQLLKPTTTPLVLLENLSNLPGINSTELAHQATLFQEQNNQLQIAKTAISQLFAMLETLDPYKTQVVELNETQQKALKDLIFKCQPFMVYISPSDRATEKTFINAFNESSSITVENLLQYKQHAKSSITSLIESNAKIKNNIDEKYQQVKSTELREHKLENMAAKPKVTLFNSIAKLNLEQKMHHFRTIIAPAFLRENLSEQFLKSLKLETLKFPISEFHTDTDSEALYKKTLNAFYYMEEMLKTISEIDKLGKPGNIITRGQYLKPVIYELIQEITQAYAYLSQASQQKQLQKLIEESLKILEPLESTPFIGNLLQDAKNNMLNLKNKLMDQTPIIDIWHNQMELVAQSVGIDAPKPLQKAQIKPPHEEKQPEKKTRAPISATSLTIELYKLEEHLENIKSPPSENQPAVKNKSNSIEKAKNLIMYFENLSINPSSLQEVITGISKTISDVNNIAFLGREVIFARLEDVPDETLTKLLKSSDLTEIKLGLKPGTISNAIIDKFDEFYLGLLSTLEFDNETTAASLINSSHKVIDYRIEFIKQYLKKLKISSPATKLHTEIFNENSFNQIKKFSDEFTLDVNFSDDPKGEKDRRNFLNAYDKLQPHLAQIDPFTFDRFYFLRELQTPEDFINTCKKITAMKPKLTKLIETSTRRTKQQQALCNEKISSLQRHKSDHANKMKTQRLDQYINIIVKSHIKQNIEQQLPNDQGKFHAILINELYSLYDNKIKLAQLDLNKDLKSQISTLCGSFKDEILDNLNNINDTLVKLNNIELELPELSSNLKDSANNPFSIEIKEKVNEFQKDLDAYKKIKNYSAKTANTLLEEHKQLSYDIKRLQTLELLFNHMETQKLLLPDNADGHSKRITLNNYQEKLISGEIKNLDFYKQILFDAELEKSTSKRYHLNIGIFKPIIDRLIYKSINNGKNTFLESIELSSNIKLNIKENSELIKQLSQLNKINTKLEQELQGKPSQEISPLKWQKHQYLKQYQNQLKELSQVKEIDKSHLTKIKNLYHKKAEITQAINIYNAAYQMRDMLIEIERQIDNDRLKSGPLEHILKKEKKIIELKNMLYNNDNPKLTLHELHLNSQKVYTNFKSSISLLNQFSSNGFIKLLYDFVKLFSKSFAKNLFISKAAQKSQRAVTDVNKKMSDMAKFGIFKPQIKHINEKEDEQFNKMKTEDTQNNNIKPS